MYLEARAGGRGGRGGGTDEGCWGGGESFEVKGFGGKGGRTGGREVEVAPTVGDIVNET